MCQCCLIYLYFFNIYICTKRYHGMCKYRQVNFFSNVVKYVRPTYGNKEELAPLNNILIESNRHGKPYFRKISNVTYTSFRKISNVTYMSFRKISKVTYTSFRKSLKLHTRHSEKSLMWHTRHSEKSPSYIHVIQKNL